MIDSCIYVSIKVSFSLFCQPCHTLDANFVKFWGKSDNVIREMKTLYPNFENVISVLCIVHLNFENVTSEL